MNKNELIDPISVAIVEDYDLLRQKFAKLIRAQPDMQCILQTDSIGKFFVELDLLHLPDVLLLDIQLGYRNSLSHIEQLRLVHPGIKIIIITGYDTPEYIISALKTGIDAYYIKGDSSHKLIDIIRTAYRGGAYFSPEAARVIAEMYAQNNSRR